MQVLEIWEFREGVIDSTPFDVVGYEVEAVDGSIGKVDEATYDAGSAYIVVETGPWIFGKKVMLPAGVITGVDTENAKVFVDRTKDQIKDAPEYDDALTNDQAYRTTLGSYYDRAPQPGLTPSRR
jgi:hypothetical protein